MKGKNTSWTWKVRACLGIYLGGFILLSLALFAGEAAAQPTMLVEAEVCCTGVELGANPSVSMDGFGRFIVSWSRPKDTDNDIFSGFFVQRYLADGTADDVRAQLSVANQNDVHQLPSIAMNLDGRALVSWMAFEGSVISNDIPTVLSVSFDYEDVYQAPPQEPPPLGMGHGDWQPSAGIAATATDVEAVTYANTEGEGLAFDLTPGPLGMVVACEPPNLCFVSETPTMPTAWGPTLSQRGDAAFALSWADAEFPDVADSPFDVTLQVYDGNGNLVGQPGENPIHVNIPEQEGFLSNQQSSAVSFNNDGLLIVVWTGGPLLDCTGTGHVFARRFFWDGDPLNTPVPLSAPFQVDSDPESSPISGVDANPTVAFSRSEDPDLCGSFVVAFNAHRTVSPIRDEVHAQYFGPSGQPIAGEFRVNQATSETGGGANRRLLANSAQHTADYGPEGQALFSWAAVDSDGLQTDVFFTLLPPDYPQTLLSTQSPSQFCVKGDINIDGAADGLDIQPFVDLLLGLPEAETCFNVIELCRADNDCDGDLDLDDIPGFVLVLLGGPPCQGGGPGGGCAPMPVGGADCNGNGVYDPNDIKDGTSEDCNQNFTPDECDLDPSDPDGNGQTSNDVNENSVPDECEPDCNGNGVPDDADIDPSDPDGNGQTSADINGNGIPDECEPDCNGNGIPDEMDIDPADPDGNELVSPDCNANGVPDECEGDCNANGVPDDCDIDPADPDGNQAVSPDCNENGVPDECDLTRPILRSLDCNDNSVPDECDLAECPPNDPSCADCNANGFLDGCDIASGRSNDADENGIPDACETQQMQGGGEGPAAMGGEGMPESPAGSDGDGLSPEELAAAWDEFYAWNAEQTWDPASGLSGAEQYELLVCKLEELGLPIENPWLIGE